MIIPPRPVHGMAALVLIGALCAAIPASGCTAFSCTSGGVTIAAKNYDWTLGDGLIMVNQRGVSKTLRVIPDAQSPRWVSRYGSVTFNQYGRDLPQGGMNEAGLVAEVLWLQGTEYPADDERDDVGCSQWVQYQLDTAATVEEVVASCVRIQIRAQVPLHFFVADRNGHTASMEFLDGREVFHFGSDMPAEVLTNSPYAVSLTYLQAWESRHEVPPSSSGSLDRFVRCASMVTAPDETDDPVAFGFGVLDAVAQAGLTQWRIIYDQTHLVAHVRTRECPVVRTIAFDTLDFTCGQPIAIADMGDLNTGNGVSWRPYSSRDNLDLVTRAYRGTPFLSSVPESLYAVIAAYPDHSHCAP